MIRDQARHDERVSRELTHALYEQQSTTLAGVALGIALFGAFQWSRAPWATVAVWVALHFGVVGVHLLLGRAYFRQRDDQGRAPAIWARRHSTVMSLSGLLWGAGAALFFRGDDLVSTAFLMIFYAGVVVVCLIAVSSHSASFVRFSILTMTPLIVRCLAHGGVLYDVIVAVGLVFILLCVLVSRRLQRILVRSVELRFQNEDLVERLEHEKERAEEALLAKSKFLAAASHDLRQPLHALSIFVELLGQKIHLAEQRHFLDRIQSSSRALEGLLNGLLDISRIDSQALSPQRSHFRLSGLVEQLGLEHAEEAERKGLTLDVSARDIVVESDREILGRILRNLLSNAVRHTSEGAVSLSVRDGDGDTVEISVADTGHGIPPDERDKVFQEFYQIGNPERDREKGLGLGLSIVRGLCRALGHRLTLVSQPERDVGTEFVLRVPGGQKALVAPARADEAMHAGSLSGRRVLIIDDERDIRAGMAALLDSWKCEALCASTLDEALDLLAHADAPPDAVICDYRLPDNVTGTRALEHLERRFGTPLAAVIVSGDTSPEQIGAMKSSGRPFLFKPVMPGKLRAVLTALLAGETGVNPSSR